MPLAPFTTGLRPDAKTPPADTRKSHYDEEPAAALWQRAHTASHVRFDMLRRAQEATTAFRRSATRKTYRAKEVAWNRFNRAAHQWQRVDAIAAEHTVWYGDSILKQRKCVACYGEQSTEVSA